MDGEKDLVKLALPFMLGIVAANCLSGNQIAAYNTVRAAFWVLSITLAFASIYLIFQHKTNLFIVVSACFLAGFLTGGTSSLRSLSTNEDSLLVTHTKKLGISMQNSIDSIDFESNNTNALLKALITGEREDIPRETSEAFRESGASHILALSGLHLGIIYMIISRVLGIAGGNPRVRRIRSATTIIICSIYSFSTGAGPSITRALIFIILGESAKLLHRKASLGTILLSSAIIHLTLNPSDLMSVGFQLSYAAIAGIAWIHPRLNKFWTDESSNKGLMKRIWDSACLSISCQLTTGPIAWLYFGTFPKYFLLTNLIALPLTGILIPFAILTTVLNCIGLCPTFLIMVTEALSEALCNSLRIIAQM